MGNIDQKNLETMIRKILGDIIAEKQNSEDCACDGFRHVDKSGIMSIHIPIVKPEPFDTGKAGDKVFLKDVVSVEESPRLGIGVMEMDKSTFKWTLNYDEVDYIIDGTLEIHIDGRKVVGHAGDVIFIPARSTIEFSVPNFARFLYVVYPANWQEQK